jgi:hypothetical protein
VRRKRRAFEAAVTALSPKEYAFIRTVKEYSPPAARRGHHRLVNERNRAMKDLVILILGIVLSMLEYWWD